MRIRVGYGGPRKYRHGQYFPGGRPNNGNMTEIERFIHLIASMQILFGSRRGGAIIPLLIIGALVGGWFLYRHNYSPEKSLERAHQLWESNDTKKQMAAISTYKDLLNKSDPIEPNRHWLMDERDKLYRRIIRHEIKFAESKDEAGEWIRDAWDEGLRQSDLRFIDSEVIEFWEETTANFRQSSRARKKNRRTGILDDQIKARRTNDDDGEVEVETPKEKGKFDDLPGIDSNGSVNRSPSFMFA